MQSIIIYDTTLRDGSQAEGVSYSIDDKVAIAKKLDEFGVDYIEGGYPGSNPKEMIFFREAGTMKLKHARLVAFGSTRRHSRKAYNDANIRALLRAGTDAVAIVGKSWTLHVRDVLRVSPDENLRMIEDTVRYLKKKGKEVLFDAEHFFDGYKEDANYATKVLIVAQESGADIIVLCDTNGGCTPDEVRKITADVRSQVDIPLGIHAHNDADLAVANSLAAIDAGVTHVQGTVNGIGERCGNADLCSLIANIVLKKKLDCRAKKSLNRLTELSRFVSEITNIVPRDNQPYVGASAFAHKAGYHVDGVQKTRKAYEHIPPEVVGNERRLLLSELSGKSTVRAKLERLGLTRDMKLIRTILKRVQDMENAGYQFEAADASFELMVRKTIGKYKPFFELEGFRVIVEKRENGIPVTEATIKIRVRGQQELSASEGDGPVNALDGALRKALERFYPILKEMRLVDYKVRVINPKAATAAKVRVFIESRDHESIWGTVGVSENLIEASWQALVDSVEYKLLKDLPK